ncbi:glycoside hydrolase family 32 protein [Sinomicrobium weinanense]|uniref:Glycoside hydrolase family 32 protein n=1 Tax=Sinomicrobium weinanense TaxID=2842200 RepID=A0A926Q3T3_9FLAO|nr:glycoside hydrolase family 32 protein [Sinomicrobium weinanense]MBC9796120.1 glycoside hydrolase family 32 protein [Sinomicrobium weinanense]MBU3124789.1 glycoside hydrolase family 32 protein [Sinomicrobium weinanense]
MKKTVITKAAILPAFLFFLIACGQKNGKKEATDSGVPVAGEEERYRPNFHFTPKEKWMNDPNGMFYYNGYYHLFFQHYPDSTVWGPMHWGHAVSTDLLNWKELPIALYPGEEGYIFSGSAVVDHENTSGLSTNDAPPVVAMYTIHDPEKEDKDQVDVETQGIAYSTDEGMTWTKYRDNPVIQNPGIRDFRDPKVVRDTIRNQWIMVLAAQDRAKFYRSDNLKDWEFLSDFGVNTGAHGGVWECPDFFPLTAGGTGETKWVLLQSLNPGGPNSGSATQYFIGDFDGTTFTLDPEFEVELNKRKAFWIDYGKDNYAGVTWSGIPGSDGRKLFIGWMSNWEYAQEVPTTAWRSAMTLPRELQLVKSGTAYQLVSQPIRELKDFRAKAIKKQNIALDAPFVYRSEKGPALSSTEIKLTLEGLGDSTYRFELYNTGGDTLSFGLNNAKKEFFMDRRKAGQTDFSEKFAAKISTAPRFSSADTLDMHIILDKTSAEVFYDNGTTVMTEVFFLKAPFDTFSLNAGDPGSTVKSIAIHQLKFN